MPTVAHAAIALATFLGMEVFAWAMHKYVMHGIGWGWHRSHHEPHAGWFETNDLYAGIFVGLAVACFLGAPARPWLFSVGLGMTGYGLAYALIHDGLVHQRWPFRAKPRNAYLRRLVQAHRLHHAIRGRDRCVSFGFLYAPPIRRLRRSLMRENPALKSGERRA